MLLESSSKQITSRKDLALSNARGLLMKEDFLGSIEGFDKGDMFYVDPPLTLCDNIQIPMKEVLLSQLLYIEETQKQMYQYQQQATQLRNQCNPLLKRLSDLQKRKPKVVIEEKESPVTTEHSSQLPLSRQMRTPEVPRFRETKVPKIRLRRMRDSSSWEILTPSNESKNELQGDEDTPDAAYKKPRDKVEKGKKRMKKDEQLKMEEEKRSPKTKGKKTRVYV